MGHADRKNLEAAHAGVVAVLERVNAPKSPSLLTADMFDDDETSTGEADTFPRTRSSSASFKDSVKDTIKETMRDQKLQKRLSAFFSPRKQHDRDDKEALDDVDERVLC